jgi:DNA helicase II / ATP-dependent DNA helicase PcrA
MTKLTMAGPGAGKTQDLTDQINAKKKGGVNPYSILAMTFSRKAANEITERTGNTVEGRTFHGFANWLIRLGCGIRNEEPPMIVADKEQERIVERAIMEAGDPYIEREEVLKALDEIRVFNRPKNEIRPDLLKAAEMYLKILDHENNVDFTRILERGALELADPRVRKKVLSIYKHVYVDEFQDQNPYLEFPLIQPFLDVLEGYSSPSQQIYTFRGANWDKMVKLLPDDTELKRLTDNFRSTPEIVKASRYLAGPDAADMKSVRESLGIPVKIYKMLQNDRDLDLQTLVTIIKTWQKKALKPREIAVLSRSGNISKIRRGLTHFGIDLASGSFFSGEAVVGALNHLWLALHPTDPQALEGAMGYPGPSLGLTTRSVMDCERVTWDELAWIISDSQFAVAEQDKALRMFRRHAYNHHVLHKYPSNEKVSIVVEQLLAPLRDTLLKEGWFPSASEVSQLVDLAGEFDTLPRFADYLRQEVENVKYTEDGVSVMTIHKSKGTEFKGVIVPGWIDGLIPADTDDPQTEKNLAYVGMTRAMDRLALTVPGAPPSPYLRGMRETSVIHV